jgi:hypothetical protein
MSRVIRFTTFFFGGAVAAALSACDVQVHDATPAEYPANHDVGMYEIKATVTTDAMVTPGSVFLFGVSGKKRFELTSNRAGTEWHAMYPIRCVPSFPLQLLAVWKLQGLATEQKVVPAQPREIKLVEQDPALKSVPAFDTTGKSPKGGWDGSVKYRFVTQQLTQITAAHIEPVSQDAADVAAAKAISVTSPMPVDIQCGVQTDVQVTSTAPHAKGNLVIDSNDPAYPHWTTTVEFAPKS